MHRSGELEPRLERQTVRGDQRGIALRVGIETSQPSLCVPIAVAACHGGRAIVGVSLKPREAGQHTRRIKRRDVHEASDRFDAFFTFNTMHRASVGPAFDVCHQLFGQHRIGQAPGRVERLE